MLWHWLLRALHWLEPSAWGILKLCHITYIPFQINLGKLKPKMCHQLCYWPRLEWFYMFKGEHGSFSSTKEVLAALAKLGQRLQVVTFEMAPREHVNLKSLKTLRDYCHRSLKKNAFLRHDLLEVQILTQHASSSSSLPPAPPAQERVCPSRRQTGSSAGGCDPGERDKERPQRANCSTAVKSHCGRAPRRSLEEHNAVSDKHSVSTYI